MNQSRLESLIEAGINVLIGFVVAFTSQLVIFPMVGIHIPITTNLEISAWFTLVSVARTYFIRRFFNAQLHLAALRLAGRMQRIMR